MRLRRALAGKSKFEVETPTAVAAVRGTIFRVTVRGDGTSEVSVWKGTVSVETEKGEAVTVSDGASVVVGQAVGGGPEPMSEAEQEQWQEHSSVIGPFLQVDSPADGMTLETTSCTVSGRTEPDCTVTASGSAVAVSKDGKFSTTIELGAGEQVIEVKATAPDGSETTMVRTVSVSLP